MTPDNFIRANVEACVRAKGAGTQTLSRLTEIDAPVA